MSLTPWTTFVEACHTGSLSATAQILGYTQSAVSRQIAALEREIGVTLLSREPRGVRLTPAGEALLPHARLVVAEAGRGVRAATAARTVPHLVIGAVPSAAVSLVPAAVRRFPDGIDWTLVTGLTPGLLERVAGGELDVAVVTDAPPGLDVPRGLGVTRLGEDPMAVVLPGDHRLARRRRVGVTDLVDERWIEDNAGSEALLRQLAARHGVTLDVDRVTTDLMNKTALVAAGHGVALVPRMLASALRPDIRLIDLAGAPRRGVYAVHREGREDLGPVVSALRRPETLVTGRGRRAAGGGRSSRPRTARHPAPAQRGATSAPAE